MGLKQMQSRSCKQVIVAGITSELGGFIAHELSKEHGMRIIGTTRHKNTRKGAFPRNVQVLHGCDLTSPKNCARVAALARRTFKGSFGLIHSVGDFTYHVPLLKEPEGLGKQMLESHVNTLYTLFKAIAPVMKSKGGGSVVTFSCNSVLYNYPWMAAFTAAKSAVESLVRSLAHEFSGEGIRCNSLALASTKTRKVKASRPHGDYANFISPKDLVPVVQFLLSPESRLVNGNAISLYHHSDTFYGTSYFERVAS